MKVTQNETISYDMESVVTKNEMVLSWRKKLSLFFVNQTKHITVCNRLSVCRKADQLNKRNKIILSGRSARGPRALKSALRVVVFVVFSLCGTYQSQGKPD